MLNQRAIKLLQDLIEIESFSKNESGTAKRLEKWFQDSNIPFQRKENNLWAVNKSFDPKKPTLLLNSHHDTVLPNKAYTRNPFVAEILDGKLYGLGSNDAGGALVSLISTFKYFNVSRVSSVITCKHSLALRTSELRSDQDPPCFSKTPKPRRWLSKARARQNTCRITLCQYIFIKKVIRGCSIYIRKKWIRNCVH